MYMALPEDALSLPSVQRRMPHIITCVLVVTSTAYTPGDATVPLTAAECPTCAFANFSCRRRSCALAPQVYSFDFRYATAGCWESIPSDHRSVILDVDLQCQNRATPDFPVTCDNMDRYRFYGIAILGGCQGVSAGASDLVREECYWACKHGRPFARCKWHFDPEGKFEALRGPLQACWFHASCAGEHVDVHLGCNPLPPWAPNGTGHAELEEELSQAIADHAATLGSLTAAQQGLDTTRAVLENLTRQHDSTQDELAAARTAHRAAEERYSEAAAANNETAAALEISQSSHTMTLHQLLRTHLSFNAEVRKYESEAEGDQRRITWLLVVVISLCGLVVILLCSVAYLMWRRKTTPVESMPQADFIVVVGRPVGNDSAGTLATKGSRGLPAPVPLDIFPRPQAAPVPKKPLLASLDM